MSTSINKVTLLGLVGAVYPANNGIVNLSIATSHSWKDKATEEFKTDTQWHKVTCFSYAADKASKFLPGDQVLVEGQLKTDEWDDKTSGEKKQKTYIKASHIAVNLRKSERPARTAPKTVDLAPNLNAGSPGQKAFKQDMENAEKYTEDDIPF